MHVQIDIFLRLLFSTHRSRSTEVTPHGRARRSPARSQSRAKSACAGASTAYQSLPRANAPSACARTRDPPIDRPLTSQPRPIAFFPPFAVAAGPRTPTDVIPNKFVEANGAAREVLEKGFRFTPRNLGIFAVFGIAVPVLIYKGCVDEFVRAQDSLRDELSSDSPPFFSLAADPRTIPSPNGRGKTRLTAFRSLASTRPRTALHG